MFELTNKHLEFITADVSRSDVSYSHLKYDLIDHICCDLENEMSHGLPFEKAYETVKKKIGIHGLKQIQEDTLSLIDKKYRIMKNTMKIFGVVAPILMAFGALFKIEHWPGAGVLLTIGFFLLCFVFLPSAVYVSYREVSNRKKLVAHLSGFLAAFLFAASFLLKVQHWPGAPFLMFAASIISGLIFIPAFFINQLKECPKNQRITYVFGFMGSLFYLIGFLFKFNHWPGASIAMFAGSLFLILVAFPLLVVTHYKNYEHVSSRYIFLTYAVVWFIVPTSLVSLSISGDTLQRFKSDNVYKEYHIQYLTSKNNQNITKLEQGHSSESLKTYKIVMEVKKNSDELVNYIQNVKIRIISLVAGKTIEPNMPINFEEIDANDRDACREVLVNEGEAKKLSEKLESYRLLVIQIAGIDSISANLISKILQSTLVTKDSPDSEKIWGNYNLITTANKLSVFQENILTAEKIVLREASKNTVSKLFLASSK